MDYTVFAVLAVVLGSVAAAFYAGWDRGHSEGFKDGLGRARTLGWKPPADRGDH